MKKIYLITPAVLIAVFVFFGSERSGTSGGLAPTTRSSTAVVLTLETQTNNDGPVTVEVTPKISSEIVFEVALNTHSTALDVDLVQASVLGDDKGKEYKPLRWEGDPPGGHHRSGALVFSSIIPVSKTLKLTIRGVGGMADRVFLWIISP